MALALVALMALALDTPADREAPSQPPAEPEGARGWPASRLPCVVGGAVVGGLAVAAAPLALGGVIGVSAAGPLSGGLLAGAQASAAASGGLTAGSFWAAMQSAVMSGASACAVAKGAGAGALAGELVHSRSRGAPTADSARPHSRL